MRRAWGYCRISVSRSGEETDSLDMQRRTIEAICVAEGFELAGVYSDPGVSGSVPFGERQGGSELLSVVQSGDIIVALKLDRAFRSSQDALNTLEFLKQKGVGLFLKDLGGDVTSSSVSALVFSLLASVANFERARIGERIADSKQYLKGQNRFLGGKHVPFGYSKEERDGRAYLEPVPEIIEQARSMKAQGLSLRRAAQAFQAQGHTVSHCGVAALYRSL